MAKILSLLKKKYLNVEYKRIEPQIHRGIPHQNRIPITQVMEFRRADFGFPF